MLPLILAALACAPPDESRLPSTDESAVYEPAEDAPAREDPLAPIEITPPPERTPSEPVVTADVIVQPAEPLSTPRLPDLPPPPPPPSGAGRLVGGSFALGLGLGAAAAVIVETTRPDGNPRFVASTFVPLGLASIGVGTYLLIRGAKARANFNEWRAYTNRETLPTGDGLIVAGTMSLVIGSVTLVAASVQARESGGFDRWAVPATFAVGGVGVAVGIGALTWGLMRRSRYRIWRQTTFLSAVPTIAPIRGGMSFGLAGRF